MIDIKADADARIITIAMKGVVTTEDQDRADAAGDDVFGPQNAVRLRSGSGGYRVLLDWEQLEGWERGAKSAGTLLGLSVRDLVGRVAIVAAEQWRDEEPRIVDVCNRADVRFFTPDRRAEAVGWLQQD